MRLRSADGVSICGAGIQASEHPRDAMCPPSLPLPFPQFASSSPSPPSRSPRTLIVEGVPGNDGDGDIGSRDDGRGESERRVRDTEVACAGKAHFR